MRRRIAALIALAAVALGACGAADDTTTTGTEPGPDPGGERTALVLDVEVVALAEGEATPEARPVGRVDPGDPEAAAARFVASERGAVADAVAGADLDGRTLLAVTVHEGCFLAGGVVLTTEGDAVAVEAADLHPEEGEVDCARPVTTTALVTVPTADLPERYRDLPEGDPGEPVPADLVLLEDGSDRGRGLGAPGAIVDRIDLEAFAGRFDLGPVDDLDIDAEVLDRLDAGRTVLVGDEVSGGCQPITGAHLNLRQGDLSVLGEAPPDDPDVMCEAPARAIVLLAVDLGDLPLDVEIGGGPFDAPAGLGTVVTIEAAHDGVPDEADLTLPPVPEGAVRRFFVVEGCQPATAEVVVDDDAETLSARLQQGTGVECDTSSPFLVVADVAGAEWIEDHAVV